MGRKVCKQDTMTTNATKINIDELLRQDTEEARQQIAQFVNPIAERLSASCDQEAMEAEKISDPVSALVGVSFAMTVAQTRLIMEMAHLTGLEMNDEQQDQLYVQLQQANGQAIKFMSDLAAEHLKSIGVLDPETKLQVEEFERNHQEP